MDNYDNWRVTHDEDCTYIEAPRELDKEFDDLDLRVTGNFMPEDRGRVAELIAGKLNVIDQTKQITELKAHVERLREVLTSGYMTSDAQGGYHCAVDPLVKHLALNETPAQSLAEIKAGAVEEAVKRFAAPLAQDPVIHECVLLFYAKQLREGE